MKRTLARVVALCVGTILGSHGVNGQSEPVDWRLLGVSGAWLESPGGRIEFNIDIWPAADGKLEATLEGAEVLHVPVSHPAPDSLVLDFVQYDSRIQARWDPERGWEGIWTKRTGPDTWAKLPFRARGPRYDIYHFKEYPSVAGRWAVRFSGSDAPAVGVFEQPQANHPYVQGTFLTVTGDYRYLHGTISADSALHLQCFDGAHAFLFKAQLGADGTLAGDFWSRDTWHETWTARRDSAAALPDAMQLSLWNESVSLAELAYPDPTGKSWSLADAAFAGKARLIEVFGTWCPNCNDATRYMMELDRRYRDRGLAILGLAFEVSGDFQRDAAQVRRYVLHHGLQYPILLAGKSDKDEASKAFPALDRVRAYPTTIFLDATGRVRGVYTGYSGPATGPAHDELRRQFEALIETLLSES